MRPLYLDGREPLSVSLDGPALCVRGLKRADGRYPLGRVSRVMVSGAVHWQTEALLACMKAGVIVCFTDADGVIVGHCLGATQRATSLSRRLDEFLDRPDWETLYRNWCESAERDAILQLQRRLRLQFPSLRTRDVQKTLLQYATSLMPAAVPHHHIVVRLQGHLHALVLDLLRRSGLGAELEVFRNIGLDLHRDFCRLLWWDLQATTLELLTTYRDKGEPSHAVIVREFEAPLGYLKRRFRRHLRHLARWLCEMAVEG
ncbi:MAG: hypothetical protein FIA96_07385 [Betaproteobacteria bacterium]|nr:CRISPR-associated endonuclease Cas1 [Candidatus Methylomirabilis sp.]NJD34639.1 hypothetical protein [Betaproteobacteria bacterium]